MIISGGTDVIRCKMFMGTFTGTTLQWFSGIPDGQITSFSQFSRMFREQFSINKVKPPRLYDLFCVRKREGEPLKDYLNLETLNTRWRYDDRRFWAGIAERPFNDSLIRNPVETFVEVRSEPSPTSKWKRSCLRRTTTRTQGNLGLKRAVELSPFGSTKPLPRRERTRGMYHTLLGKMSPGVLEYPIKNSWVC